MEQSGTECGKILSWQKMSPGADDPWVHAHQEDVQSDPNHTNKFMHYFLWTLHTEIIQSILLWDIWVYIES